jgi:alkylation response protein AidB-like acyl-CoA dehydrogenase
VDFAFTPDQDLIRGAARDVLTAACAMPRVAAALQSPTGYDTELWRTMGSLGWTGWILPSSVGGGGGRLLDLIVLQEELGRAALQTPFFTSAVLAGLVILEAASPDEQQRLLPGIASGTAIVSAAIAEPGTRVLGDHIACRAAPVAGGWRVSGVKTFTAYADVSDRLIVAARMAGGERDTDGLLLITVDPRTAGVTLRATPTLGRDQQFEITLADVLVADADVLGVPGAAHAPLARALDRTTVCLAAEMLGGAQAVLEMTIAYALERSQRGRPIGRHQALQHRIADASIAVEAAGVLIHNAAWRLDQGLPAAMEASMAKAAISDTYRETTWLAALIHGGVGFMEEHPLSRHYRRAKVAEFQLGDADTHRELVARALLD